MRKFNMSSDYTKFYFLTKVDTFKCLITALGNRVSKIQMKIRGKYVEQRQAYRIYIEKLGGNFYESFLCFEIARIDFKPNAETIGNGKYLTLEQYVVKILSFNRSLNTLSSEQRLLWKDASKRLWFAESYVSLD